MHDLIITKFLNKNKNLWNIKKIIEKTFVLKDEEKVNKVYLILIALTLMKMSF